MSESERLPEAKVLYFQDARYGRMKIEMWHGQQCVFYENADQNGWVFLRQVRDNDVTLLDMEIQKRLSEAETTAALDQEAMPVECLPGCPTDGAYGCTGTCPCPCHDKSGTRLVVPEEALLTDEELDVVWGNGGNASRWCSDAATEKAYPLGFEAGWKAQDAKVAKLQWQIYVNKTWADETMRRMELAETERDAVLADVASQIKATTFEAELLDKPETKLDAALEQVRALAEAGEALNAGVMGEVGINNPTSVAWRIAIAKANESNVGGESC